MRDEVQVSAPIGSIFGNGLHFLSRQENSYEQLFVDNFFLIRQSKEQIYIKRYILNKINV
ncbi:MAG: hypothetical protein FWH36_09365 [Lentimicrobiaceae bacterium]|nr:hypothetical protein [Lentimicrobiaceae bacterium]